ncbi:glycoside hydrolase family 3 N-terminal domain-containing protein, partial [Balneolaceae bacterium ANBcel3]|nr:glycoside hydrolase family 3 N-terminal domain-containing protein [Balneolaceae bacterium ANBcel3]
EHGMLATLKHFPGNGGTMLDQHIAPAYIGASRETMEAVYLKPYRELIQNVQPEVIMVAHLEVPSLCTEKHPQSGRVVPASMSEEIITGLLKQKMRFDGMVITDATNMGGVNNLYTREEAVVKTIQAGSDMILDFYPEDFERDYQALLDAVKSGSISEERLNDAVRRVLTAKYRAGLHADGGAPANEEDREEIFTPGTFEPMLRDISQKGITVLRNSKRMLPLKNGVEGKSVALIEVHSPEKKVMADHGQSMPEYVFGSELRERGADVTEYEIVSSMSMADIRQVFDELRGFEVVFLNFYIVPSYGIGSLHPNLNATRLLYQGLLKQNEHLVITCFGDPYITVQCIAAHTLICALDESEITQKTVLEAILGETLVSGRMPVRLEGFFEYGDGEDLN